MVFNSLLSLLSPSQSKRGYKALDGGDQLSLLDLGNLAIPLSYFCIGFARSFVSTPLNVYLVEVLGAQPSVQTTISVLCNVPWSFKLVHGFISDVVPIAGQHRKPYFLIGYALHCTCYMLLATLPVLNAKILGSLLCLATTGQIMADVMADTMVVGRSRHEPEGKKGQLQASCYAIRFAGSIIGCLGGAFTYNAAWQWSLSFAQVCAIAGVVPFVLIGGTLWSLYEEPPLKVNTIKEQCIDIWETITLKAVWRPMAFVYVFNLFQVPNVAWSSFLQLSLLFKPYQLGLISTIGSIMTFLGIVAYKRFFFHVSWRHVYSYSVVFTTLFSLLQIVLIYQWNKTILHLGDFWFALGDDVISEYIQGIQFLPVCIMYVQMCRQGSEGATYSALTTLGNIALVCASSVGTLMAGIWDVSNDALAAHKFDGLVKLTLLTSAVAPLPLVMLQLLPASQDDQEHLKLEKERSKWGGVGFLGVLGLSLLYTCLESVVVISQS
ncbi:unnamed protein product [Chrysoparadoxa australica]